MSERKPTPGPWRAEKCPCGNPACTSGVVGPFVVHGQGSCRMADASLIAATPDLLAACKEAADDYANMCDEDDAESDGAKLLRKLRAAIAKAERR